MKCTNKQCEHRWYCKKYEMPVESTWQDCFNLNNECNVLNNHTLLEIDDVLKSLYDFGQSINKLFPNITQEDINKFIEKFGDEI